MEQRRWAPGGIDFDTPNPARIYDYLLGGSHNFEVDRLAAERIVAVSPEAPAAMRANRSFLRRAVRCCLDAGITQFLDLGSGLPSRGCVHELAQAANPTARVVYVDIDPVAVAHCQILLKDNPLATAVQADIRRPDEVLDAPETTELLDFDQPLGLVMAAVLHFVPDSADPVKLLARYTAALANGSHLVISHAGDDPEWRAGVDMAQRLAMTNGTTRSRSEIAALFTGVELLEPGLTWVEEWRPDANDALMMGDAPRFVHGGVGRKTTP